MSYTTLALLGLVVGAVLDLLVLRTKMLVRKAFWASYAIILVAQLTTNGILTGFHLVNYASWTITGVRVVYAPIEDLMFGFSLVLQTLSWWVWWGRRLRQRSAGPARRGARPVPQR